MLRSFDMQCDLINRNYWYT